MVHNRLPQFKHVNNGETWIFLKQLSRMKHCAIRFLSLPINLDHTLFYLYHAESVVDLQWKHPAVTTYNLDTDQLRHDELLEVVTPRVMIVVVD